jgi:hypothetical protein
VLVTLALTARLSVAHDFNARDLEGIRLGMTTSDVEQMPHQHLIPLGRKGRNTVRAATISTFVK